MIPVRSNYGMSVEQLGQNYQQFVQSILIRKYNVNVRTLLRLPTIPSAQGYLTLKLTFLHFRAVDSIRSFNPYCTPQSI